MKVKILKTIGIIVSLYVLWGAEAFASLHTGGSGATNWELDTDTGVLTISSTNATSADETRYTGYTGLFGSATKSVTKSFAAGEMANYHYSWYYPSDNGDGPKNNDYAGKPNYRDYASSIKSIVVEEGVVKIGAAAFAGLTELTSITLPSTLTSIGFEAFRGCSKLTTINLGPNVCTLMDRWITECPSLTTVNIDESNSCYYLDVYGAIYTADGETLVRLPQARNLSEYVIADGTVRLATDALYQCSSLEIVTIPASMKTVQYGVFDGMENLKELRFKSDVAPTFENKIGNGTDAGNLKLYVPCIPDSTLEEREQGYAAVTGIKLKNITGWLADFSIIATVAEREAERGSAKVSTVRTCDSDTSEILAEPSTGYRFAYWRQASNGATIAENPYKFAPMYSDTFYAYFAFSEFAVKVVANDNEMGSTSGSGLYEMGSEVEISAEPANDCYSFVGWTDDNSTDNTRTITVPSKDTTFTAVFEKKAFTLGTSVNIPNSGCYVSVRKNPEGEPLYEGANIYCGDSMAVSAIAAEHYHFLYWEQDRTLEAVFDTVANGALSFNAVFAIDSVSVTYLDYNGDTLQSKLYPYNEDPSCETPMRERTAEYSYAFRDWEKLEENVFRAQYDSTANEYIFTYIVENVRNTVRKIYNDTVNARTASEKVGYTFQYWMDEDSTAVEFPFTMPAKDTVVYALYTINQYKLTIYDLDSTTVLSENVYNYDDRISMVNPAPHEGYRFREWSSNLTNMPAKDTVVYALYDRLSYILTFTDRNNQAIETKRVLFESSVEAIGDPAEEGYTFLNWIDANGDAVNFPFTMPAKDTTVLSMWQVNTHNLILLKDNGEANDTIQYEFGSRVATPKTPSKEGHTFAGWAETDGALIRFGFSMPDSDVAVYAQWDINQYTLRFETNGGTSIDTMTLEFGTPVPAVNNPDKEGHAFQGWEPEIPVTMPANDVTVEAQWSVNRYTITYKFDDDSTIKVDTLYFGENITVAEEPEREGYAFVGWSSDAPNMPNIMPANNLVFTAQWRINLYRFTVDVDGVTTTSEYEYNAPVEMPESPAKHGYDFVGWTDSISVMPAKDVTTRALWQIHTHALTFVYGSENSDSIISKNEVKYGDPVLQYYPEDPEMEGYSFTGWHNNSREFDGRTMPDEDLTVFSDFEINKYEVTFLNLDGDTIQSDSIEYGGTITVPETPSYLDYTFEGWAPSVPETVPAYDLSFMAVYDQDKYTVTYLDMDSVTNLYEYEVNSAAVVNVYLPKVNHSGYTFDHWNSLNGDSIVFPITIDAQDTTMIAVYSLNRYNLTFNYGVGDSVISKRTYFYTDEVEAIDDPAREGYTFAGWDKEIPSTMPAQNITITALWTINPHSFNYIVDNVKTTIEYNYGESVEEPKTAKKEGHTFVGWIDSERNGLLIEFPFDMQDKDTTVYAAYTVNLYTLTAYDYDGSKLDSVDMEYGMPLERYIGRINTPQREGYNFTGWSQSPETMPAKNVDIFAEYEKNTYNLALICNENENNSERAFEASDVQEGEVDLQFAYGEPIQLGEVEKEGYTFVGWQLPTGAYLANGDLMPANDHAATCVFTINSHDVTFVDYNDTLLQTSTLNYSDEIVLPKDPSREGYRFTGWNPKVPAAVPDEDLTFKAQYGINQYTIAFRDYDSTAIKIIKGDFGSAVVRPTTPIREGYEFAGWTEDVPATIPAHDVNLYALYDVLSYTITYKDYSDKVLDVDTVPFGTSEKITVPDVPEREGYDFIGWIDEVPTKMPAANIICKTQYAIQQHSIKFYTSDSVLINTIVGNYGSNYTAPDAPVVDGYEFIGWSEELPATIPSMDKVVYAQYAVKSYEITFFDYDESVIMSDSLAFGTAIMSPADPERKGYTFDGWSADVPESMPSEDLFFTAQYRVNSYNVAFLDSDSSEIATFAVEYNSEIPSPSNPTKEGYDFDAWTPQVPDVMPDTNLTFVAQYRVNEYVLTFADYDKSVIDTVTVAYKDTVNAIADPVREGYSFTGWTPELPTLMPAKDITVTAKYTANKYALVFKTDDSRTIKSSGVEFGAKIVTPDVPVREGYTFFGWDKDVPETMPAHNDTFIAVYEANKYFIAYMDKETESVYYADSLNYGDKIQVPADPEKDGYTFVGWDETLITVPSVNVTIYAVWSTNRYELTYEDFDSTVIEKVELNYNDEIVRISDPEREGYSFIGWNPELPETMISEDLTVVAQYVINKYHVIFKDDNDSIVFEDTLAYGDTIVPPADPERDGYKFEGWDPELPVTVPAEDVIVKPIYSRSSFVITFKDYDESIIDQDTLEYNAKIATPKDPVREGYIFSSWNPEVPARMIAEDLTVVAQYDINKYHVIFKDDNDSIIFEDSLAYGDAIVPPADPMKEGYTFEGWDPELPETVPAEDVVVKPTWNEDSIQLKTIDAMAARFCEGEDARIYYTYEQGKPLNYVVTFSDEAVEAGFSTTQTGTIGEDGEIFFSIPNKVTEGEFKATLVLKGEERESNEVEFTFSTNLNSSYLSRMWDDVVVCDNSNEEFESYQWFKNGEEIEGATKQFYCELGGLDGDYSVMVTTRNGVKKYICALSCERMLPPFSISAYPNPAKANEEFTLEVKGLDDDELKIANIYVYNVNGTTAVTNYDIQAKNKLALPSGEYVALVSVKGKSAFCKIIVR